MKPNRGTLILVLGILGIVCCPVTGIISWILGSNDLKEMDAGVMDPSGRGLTQAGKIIGIISVVLLVIQIVLLSIFGSAFIAALTAALQQQPQ